MKYLDCVKIQGMSGLYKLFKKTFFNSLHTTAQYCSSRTFKLFKIMIIVCFFTLMSVFSVQAHSGRTDSKGGHYVTSTGEYHYHHGFPAHQHPNGICPYINTSQTNSNGNNSSSLNSKSDSSSNHLIIFFISVGGGIYVLCFLKAWHDEVKKKQQFEREKLYYLTLYKGKSINELANVPDNIDFDENDLPISIDDSGLKWGKEFTVFVTKHGHRYHMSRGCSGAYNPVNIFKETKKFRAVGCRRCSSGKNFIVPEWYDKYLEIKRIKNHYSI